VTESRKKVLSHESRRQTLSATLLMLVFKSRKWQNSQCDSSYLVRRVLVRPKAFSKFGMEIHVLGMKVFHQLVFCGINNNLT